jgi:hypothetical protein
MEGGKMGITNARMTEGRENDKKMILFALQISFCRKPFVSSRYALAL